MFIFIELLGEELERHTTSKNGSTRFCDPPPVITDRESEKRLCVFTKHCIFAVVIVFLTHAGLFGQPQRLSIGCKRLIFRQCTPAEYGALR
jgi:hypothetical protein